MSNELGKLQGLIERYASARVQSELAYERDAGTAILKRNDAAERSLWDQIAVELEILLSRRGPAAVEIGDRGTGDSTADIYRRLAVLGVTPERAAEGVRSTYRALYPDCEDPPRRPLTLTAGARARLDAVVDAVVDRYRRTPEPTETEGDQ